MAGLWLVHEGGQVLSVLPGSTIRFIGRLGRVAGQRVCPLLGYSSL
jgi:hypothetical protein